MQHLFIKLGDQELPYFDSNFYNFPPLTYLLELGELELLTRDSIVYCCQILENPSYSLCHYVIETSNSEDSKLTPIFAISA